MAEITAHSKQLDELYEMMIHADVASLQIIKDKITTIISFCKQKSLIETATKANTLLRIAKKYEAMKKLSKNQVFDNAIAYASDIIPLLKTDEAAKICNYRMVKWTTHHLSTSELIQDILDFRASLNWDEKNPNQYF